MSEITEHLIDEVLKVIDASRDDARRIVAEALRRAPTFNDNVSIAEKGAVMNEIMRGEG